jgi:hypothetical protein
MLQKTRLFLIIDSNHLMTYIIYLHRRSLHILRTVREILSAGKIWSFIILTWAMHVVTTVRSAASKVKACANKFHLM